MAGERYDVVIVGSGAGGAVPAHVLVRLGLKVILLEAGRMLHPTDFRTHTMPYELPFRGHAKPGELTGLWKINEYTAHLYTNPRKEPYDSLEGFHWTRLRAVGGRTNVWGRSCFRHGPLDFKTRSLQGFGEDWPLGYDDLEPYYDKVERLVGIAGARERYFNTPDGIFLPPHKPRCPELWFKERAERIGVPVLLERTATLNRPYGGRAPCHFCGACAHGCDVDAFFSTRAGIFPQLRDKRNFTLRTHAVAYQVLTDNEGRARGVSYFDANTKAYHEVEARAVVLAASTVESGRILLNSTSRFHPHGIGNSNRLVGRYLKDSVKSGGMSGIVPALRSRAWTNEDGVGGAHITIPRFNYKMKTGFHGGYYLLVGSGFGRGPNATGGIGGYGTSLKREIRARYGSVISLRGYGECVSDHDNFFEIDPNNKDVYGIPQVRFRTRHTENSLTMMEDMYGWMEKILRACDAEILPYRKGLEPMGDATHESGAARMGTDPKTSVLNPYCQLHDVKNLFVTDASCFVSLPGTHGITTWIMALAWRSAEYLAEQMRTGEI
jgi:choline dehydrogenase-like flavoprotein